MKLNRTYDAISNIVYKTCQDKTVITKHMHLASNRRMDPYSPTWANLSELTAIGTNKIVTLPCRPRSEWSPSSGKVLAGRWVSQRHSRLPEPRPAAPSGGRQSGRSHTALLPPCPGANGGMGLMKGRNKKEGVRKWAFPVFYNSFANSKCWTLQFLDAKLYIGLQVVTSEFLLTGILRQEARPDLYPFNNETDDLFFFF